MNAAGEIDKETIIGFTGNYSSHEECGVIFGGGGDNLTIFFLGQIAEMGITL